MLGAVPAGGAVGRPGPPAGTLPRDRRHDEVADVQPQRRRVVRHLAITGNRVLEAAAPDWDTSADGRGGELRGHGLSCGGAIGTGHWHGCGASLGALVGCVGAHRRWPVFICLLSKATPNFPQSCLARGALTGPLVGLRWRHVAGPIANPPGGLPSKFQGHPSTLARSHQARVGGSKNMAISIAPEPTHGRSVIIYTGGKALAPTHPRPISRVVAE